MMERSEHATHLSKTNPGRRGRAPWSGGSFSLTQVLHMCWYQGRYDLVVHHPASLYIYDCPPWRFTLSSLVCSCKHCVQAKKPLLSRPILIVPPPFPQLNRKSNHGKQKPKQDQSYPQHQLQAIGPQVLRSSPSQIQIQPYHRRPLSLW